MNNQGHTNDQRAFTAMIQIILMMALVIVFILAFISIYGSKIIEFINTILKK